MDKETEKVISKICCIKDTLLQLCEKEASKGCELDCDGLGDTIDMVKDLAEAEEKIVKAKYYECLMKAMKRHELEEMIEDRRYEELDDEDMNEIFERYGYRGGGSGSSSSGVRGGNSGGRGGSRGGSSMSGGGNSGSSGSYGYDRGGNSSAARSARASSQLRTASGRFSDGGGNYGYAPMMTWEYGDMDEYGMQNWGGQHKPSTLEEYREHRRHYHESHNEEDRKKMEEKGAEATEEAFGAMKELIKDADPSKKQKLEVGLQNLMTELKKN